jgi:hypothetical protein
MSDRHTHFYQKVFYILSFRITKFTDVTRLREKQPMRSNNQKIKERVDIIDIWKNTRLCCFNINNKLTTGDDVYIVFTFVELITELE